MSKNKPIVIYTDGSCNNGTGNSGGYGIVMVNGTVKKYCGGSYINTTSARMELLGVIRGLAKCEVGDRVEVYCDNSYVVNTIDKGWIFRWSIQNFKQRKNKDLLKQLLAQYNRLERRVKLKWIRGHNGHEYNELADQLAYRGAHRETKIKDKNHSKYDTTD